ncbi:hypothetical protein B0F90DRAFT_630854 [Multifurca ochricompacta]|uniref:DUF6535 domain-containing protein n=1 Tax=Multifurca ochricompacta TaxID=376703 RepID=A0AAD4QK27_9AGAM|nr:hypothetical protein B0F90DRAFT_630854 [Multifurca ochricompacta]
MSLDIESGPNPPCNPTSYKEVVNGMLSCSLCELPPTPTPTPRSSFHTEANFKNGLGASFVIDNQGVTEYNRRLVENWREDVNAAMILSGLLSVVVTVFLSQSYLAGEPNSQDPTAFHLTPTCSPLASSNVTTISSRSATLSKLSVFSAVLTSTHALWVTSLVVSLGCAASAALLQTSMRQYLFVIRRLGRSGGSLMIPEEYLQTLYAWLLASIFLFLWGLGVQQSRIAKPSFLLVIIGLCVTLFVGQCLIISSFVRSLPYDGEVLV